MILLIQVVFERTLRDVDISYCYEYGAQIEECTSEIISGFRAAYTGTNEGLKYIYDTTGQQLDLAQNIIIDDFIIEYCGRINPNPVTYQEGMDLYIGAVARMRVSNGIIRGCGHGGIEMKHSTSPNVGEAIQISEPFSAGQTFHATIVATTMGSSPTTYVIDSSTFLDPNDNLSICNSIVAELNAFLTPMPFSPPAPTGETLAFPPAVLVSAVPNPLIVVRPTVGYTTSSTGTLIATTVVSTDVTYVTISNDMGSQANSANVVNLNQATQIDFSDITILCDVPASIGIDIHWPSDYFPSEQGSKVRISDVSLFYEGPPESGIISESSCGIVITGWTDVEVDGGRIEGFNAGVVLSSFSTSSLGTLEMASDVTIRNLTMRGGNYGIYGKGYRHLGTYDLDTILLLDNDVEASQPINLTLAAANNLEIRGGRYVAVASLVSGTLSNNEAFLVKDLNNFLAENVLIEAGANHAFSCEASGTFTTSGIIRTSSLISGTMQPAYFAGGTWLFYKNEIDCPPTVGSWTTLSGAKVQAADNNLTLSAELPTIAGAKGDVVLSSEPENGVFKWVCTTAGTDGILTGSATWQAVSIS